MSFFRFSRHLLGALALVILGAAATATALAAPPAYQIPNSHVHELPRKGTNRAYQVWVSLPVSYANGNKQYPVVFVTDPQYAFALVHGIRHLLGRRGQNIEDFILVGLALPINEDAAEARSRDYTPTNALANPKRSPDQYGAKVYGEAVAYRSYDCQPVPCRHVAQGVHRALVWRTVGRIHAAHQTGHVSSLHTGQPLVLV